MKAIIPFLKLLLLTLFAGLTANAQQMTMVKDIWPGFGHSNPLYFNLANGKTFFFANDGLNGIGIFVTDGTAAGTTQLTLPAPFNTAIASINFSGIYTTPNRLWYFQTINGISYLLSTDGTTAGSYVVDLTSRFGLTNGASASAIAGETLYMAFYTPAVGVELYKTDGTDAGTVLVKDIYPGPTNSGPMNFAVTDNGTVYFSANTANEGTELWKTDGTTAGTVMVKDINPGTANSSPTSITKVGNEVYFSANDGVNGAELWKSDGTAAGTVLIKDINVGTATTSATPKYFYAGPGAVYFVATSGSTTYLYKTNGTAQGTTQVSSTLIRFPSSTQVAYTTFNGKVALYAGTAATGAELCITDGTEAGTIVIDNVAGTVVGQVSGFNVLNGSLYYLAGSLAGKNLYKTDGTVAGTAMVKKDVTVPQLSGGQLFFLAENGTTVADPDGSAIPIDMKELWKTDGSAAGLISVYTANHVSAFMATPLGVYANIMDAQGRELWFGSMKPLPTITFTLPAKTYGDGVFELTATSTNTASPIAYKSSDAAIAEVYQDAADNNKWKVKIKAAGTVVITASQGASAQYDPVNADRNLLIGKAPLTIKAKDAEKVVNAPLPVFEAEYSGFVNGENASVLTTPVSLTTTATAGSSAGTYSIVPSGAAAANYAITYVNGTLNIIPPGATAQNITFGVLANVTYGDADFDAGALSSAGLTVYYTSSDASIATIVNGKVHIVKAGTVTITANQYGTATYAAATPVSQSLTINKAPLTITAKNITRPRGQNNPTLTYTVSGFVKGEDETVFLTPVSLSTTATAASGAGQYPITMGGATADNYAITFVNGVLTVSATQLVTWNPFSVMVYGDAPFDPGAVSELHTTPVYSTDNPAVAVIDNGKIKITGAGTAVITATIPADGGYEVTTATQTLTIQKKSLIVTADNMTRKYGDANPAFTITYIGFVNGDTNIQLITQPQISTTATITSAVGVYPITVNGATSNNYAFTYVNGQLTIEKTGVTITFNDMPVKTYGDADFDAGAFSSTNEAIQYTSDNASVAIIQNGLVKITGAGTAVITANLPVAGNYTNVTPVSRTLTVKKAPLQIIAEDKVKTTGGLPVTLTARYSGLVNGENELKLTKMPTLSTTAVPASPVGKYVITVSGAQSANYDISYTNGTLTIIPGAAAGEITLDAWCSSAGTLEIRVFASEPIKAAIQLYSFGGQRLVTMEKQLVQGVNSYQMNVNSIAPGVYILHVMTGKGKIKQQVKIK